MAQQVLTRQEIVTRVRDMYQRHPFPTPQRRYTYRHHAVYVDRFLREQGIDPRGKLFGDIACGTGLMLLDYTKEFPETQFIGYDISETSIRLASQTLAEEGSHNARCYVQDIMELTDRERFDYVVSWGTIHHLPDPREGLHIICQALKPGGIIRTGIYGFYGNWERRIQREIVAVICQDSAEDSERIQRVREWARGDRNFKNYYTAPPIDLGDDDWIVDEFLHVWENHLTLRDVVLWLQEAEMEVLQMTDYYDQETSLDIGQHSTSPPFVEQVRGLPFPDQCHIIDMIVRPYWLSLFARKRGG